MELKEIVKIVDGTVVCGDQRLNDGVEYGFASDLMSDVLTLQHENFILITGLANVQSIRTAEMSDITTILLCRNKKASEEMLEVARENDMTIIESPYSLFKCAGMLYEAGLKSLF